MKLMRSKKRRKKNYKQKILKDEKNFTSWIHEISFVPAVLTARFSFLF